MDKCPNCGAVANTAGTVIHKTGCFAFGSVYPAYEDKLEQFKEERKRSIEAENIELEAALSASNTMLEKMAEALDELTIQATEGRSGYARALSNALTVLSEYETMKGGK